MRRRDAIKAVGGAAVAAAVGGKVSAVPARADLTWLPAWKLRDLIVRREVTAAAVTDHFLARIDRLDPKLHMFRKLDADGARAQAAEADRLLATGGTPGLLHGVPTALKEHVAVRGLPHGNPMGGQDAGPIALRDSITAERLRKAGAIILGVTVMPGMGTGAGMPDLARHPRNPWNLDHVPGSSSAGSAAAVASGCLPFAIGSDGGGSTRLPAAYCGLVGLHTTTGRVPDVDYGQRKLNFFSSLGPLTRDARDAALVMQTIAGPDGRAIVSTVHGPAPDYLAGLDRGAKGAKLLWMDDLGFGASYATAQTPRVVAAVRAAALRFGELGAQVTPGKGKWQEPRAWSSMLNGTYSGTPMPNRPSDDQFLAATEMRETLRADFAALLRTHDVLALPTAQVTAQTLAEWDAGWKDMLAFSRSYVPNTLMFNFLAMPAISIPCGFVDGMPVGLQLVGLPDSEPRLLQLAQAFLTRFPQGRRPALA